MRNVAALKVVAVAWALSGASLACAQPATRPAAATAPAPGSPIRYALDVRQDPPMRVHVLTVDLADPVVSVVVRPAGPDPDGDGPWATTLMTARAVAQRDGLAAAVNGDFFSPKDAKQIFGRRVPYFEGNWARPVGRASSDGKQWAWPLNKSWPCLAVSPGNKIAIVPAPADVPADAREVVGGSAILVADGKAVARGEAPSPRTAAGVDRAGKRLFLVVVDGRRADFSAGMTLEQVADEMVKLGCDRAINLDGGGSSTMVVRDPKTDLLDVANRPSDGHDLPLPLSVERPIANVLGVRLNRADGK